MVLYTETDYSIHIHFNIENTNWQIHQQAVFLLCKLNLQHTYEKSKKYKKRKKESSIWSSQTNTVS